MSNAKPMLDTYPADFGLDAGQLSAAIDACSDCTQSCTACADACLAEGDDMLGSLRQCIRLNLDCADVCEATLRILSRQTAYDANVTRAQVEACRRCEQALSQLLDAMS
jgi:hypothetical protein